MGDILVKAGQQTPTVQVTEDIPEGRLLESVNYEGQADPHVCFDASLWRMTVDPVVEQLSELGPEGAEEYERRGEAYKREISGMMAVMAGFLFVVALLFSPSQGLVANLLRRRSNRRSFVRGLQLVRLGTMGDRATEGELSAELGWDGDRVSRTVRDALRGGFVLVPAEGEVVLTRRGRETATGLADVPGG